jgi:transcriptional regulator with XRE-family HTH domain
MLKSRLKYARKAKGYTQEELASKVNVTKGTISNYENGHSTPSNEMLKDLADILNTSTDYLLGRTNELDKPSEFNKRNVTYDPLHELLLGPDEEIFFHDYKSLSDEDKQKIADHIRFLRHMADQKNK